MYHRPSRGDVLNAMTVDVEEHFQVSAFEGSIERKEWELIPSRVEANTARLLDLFDDVGVRATFFVLGWIAERHPKLVRRISDCGHEIASHGYSHKLVYNQQPHEFRSETLLSRRILQDISGQSVQGYRAATFSIGRGNLWALDVVAEAGFTYDSSLFPVIHDRYGIPGAPRHIHRIETPNGMTLVEVPPATLRLGKVTLPVAGGGYLRVYPNALSLWAIQHLNNRERMPAIVYVHPWEVDPGQPRVSARTLSRMRHYLGLRSTKNKLRNLLSRFRFGPVREVISRTDLPVTVTQKVASPAEEALLISSKKD